MGTIGHIYILKQEHMPNLVKIGRTTRTPEERAAEISSATGVPTPYKVVWAALVEDHEWTEKYLHENLSQFRISKEFFEIPADEAEQYVTSLLDKKNIKCLDVISAKAVEEMQSRAEEERMIRFALAEQEAQKILEQRRIEIQAEKDAEQKERYARTLIHLQSQIRATENSLKSHSIDDIWPKFSAIILGFLFFFYGLENHMTHAIVVGLISLAIASWLFYSDSQEREANTKHLRDLKKRYADLKAERTKAI